MSAVVLLATSASAQVSFVQARSTFRNSGPNAATVSFASPVGPQNLIVVGVTWYSVAAPTVVDSSGTGYVRAAGPTRVPSVSQSTAIYFARTASGPISVTASFSGDPLFVELFAVEYRGVDPVNPLDVTRTGIGSGQALDSGFLTTSSDRELLFALSAASNGVISPGAGYTSRGNGNLGSLIADRLVSTVGSYNATAMGSLPNSGWVVQLAAFRADGQDSGTLDAGGPDAGPADAGPPDAGTANDDAGTPDAGPPDAGAQSDAGDPTDAGDAGDLDAGPADAGAVDAGDSDAGAADAGSSDAGTPDAATPDAGPPSDAGASDAGAPSGDGGSDPTLDPREYAVGCDCTSAPSSLALVWAWLVRRVTTRRRRQAVVAR